MSTPVTLPANFASVWASEVAETKPLKTPSVAPSNPFSDKKKASTVAFSDYTESDLTARMNRQKKEDDFNNAVRNGIKVDLEYEKILEKMEKKHKQILRMREKTGELKEKGQYLDDMTVLLSEYSNLTRQASLMSIGKEQELEVIEKMQDEWEKEAKERYVTIEDFKTFTKEFANSIHPMDSASNLHMTAPRSRKLSLEEIPEQEESGSDIERTVIGGYSMSPEEKMKELDSFSNINSVRGLPVMFTNSRLNFLTHVHSALFRVISDGDGGYPSRDCLHLLLESRKAWGDEPSVLLLEQVIDSTIDVRTGVVKANPFRIPILEPTMILTEKIMFMALDQLHREFETEWFNTMKFITTPKFQSKYENLKFRTERRKPRSGHERRTSSSSSSGRATSSRRSSSGSSIISTLFG